MGFVLRSCSVAAATAALVAMSGGAALAVEPVDTVVKTVENETGVNLPGTGVGGIGGPIVAGPGGGGIDGIGGVRGGRSAVVGYITITYNTATGDDGPSYGLHGALSDPAQWSCAGAGTGASYTVTCLPVALVLPMTYHCDVLHADASTLDDTGSARASLDCDNDGVAEAETQTVTGAFGHDSKWSVDTRAVTAFRCTVDNAAPSYVVGCGDPGLVGVE